MISSLIALQSPCISVFAFYGWCSILLAIIVTLFMAEMAAQISIIAITVPFIETIPGLLMSMVDAHMYVSLPSLFPNLWYGQFLWNVLINFVTLDFQGAQPHFLRVWVHHISVQGYRS